MKNNLYEVIELKSFQEILMNCTHKNFSILGKAFPTFTEFLEEYDCSTDQEITTFWTSDVGKELWRRIVVRYLDKYIITMDESHDERELMFRFVFNLYNTWKMQFNRYKPLIDLEVSNLSKLMNQIKTTSGGKTRFNDTPQNSGEYSDDAHTSNITQTDTESLTDGDTPMARLDEINKHLEDYYGQWVKTFEGLFIEGENL